LGRECSTKGSEENYIYDIGGKARKNRELGRKRNRRVDNIKRNLREIG
jgi:hypothetical protein